MDIKRYMLGLGQKARASARRMALASTSIKNNALHAISDNILTQKNLILAANAKDLSTGREKGLDEALLDRLMLNPDRIQSIIDGLNEIALLPDPVGEITDLNYRPSGIQVGKMRAPLGVIGIIYESRPNVTADAAGLCLKSGNATILRGGSEASHSNHAIAKCIQNGLSSVGLPSESVQVVEPNDRQAVTELVRMQEYVDVIVPRGGKGLIERISADARIPVIKHLHGICHVYIDDKADLKKAINIAFNAKTHRYGVCNAMETLLVADSVASSILPELANRYAAEKVELRGCDKTRLILPSIRAATDEDWDTEYLAPILSIRIVNGIDEAIEHLFKHSSGHTDAIVTEDLAHARKFMTEVDSSSVMVNASTRFADGFEYGLGAEIGISTDKIHVRGPVGLHGLTSQKYIVIGDGNIRS